MFEDYLLESYMIDYLSPAIEGQIDDKLGDTKLGRKEKRLAAAVQNGDDEKAKQIEEQLRRDAAEMERIAKAEKNKQLAQKIISLSKVVLAITGFILSRKNANDQNKLFDDIKSRNGGTLPRDVQAILDAQARGAASQSTISKLDNILGVVSSAI